jgi:toxin CptA
MSGPLRVRLHRSNWLAAALCTAHAVAAAALWASQLPWWMSAIATATIAASAAWTVRGHAFRTAASAVVELELYEDCTLSACTADGRWLRYRMVGSSFLSRVLTVLNLRAEDAWIVRSVLISADGMDRDAFRRLRVWLRWRCSGHPRMRDDDVIQ